MDLVRAIARQANIPVGSAERVLDTTMLVIRERVAAGYRIALKDFGVFEAMKVLGRAGVNPQTKEHIEIPGHTKISFRPAQAWKDMVKND